jgi:hypothetical protein
MTRAVKNVASVVATLAYPIFWYKKVSRLSEIFQFHNLPASHGAGTVN